MALSAQEQADVITLRDQLLRELPSLLDEVNKWYASVQPSVWREVDGLEIGLTLARAAQTLLDPTATEEQHEGAAETLARDLPAGLRRPGAWRAWNRVGREMAKAWGCSRSEALRRLLPLGVKLAVEKAHTPDTIRLGRKWIVDANGQKRRVAPAELPLSEFLWWLAIAAYRHVTEVAGSEPRRLRGAQESEIVGPDALAQLAVASKAGARLLATRRKAEQATQLLDAAVKKPLSNRQRRILEMRAQGLTTREIAAALGISASTVCVHQHRARQK